MKEREFFTLEEAAAVSGFNKYELLQLAASNQLCLYCSVFYRDIEPTVFGDINPDEKETTGRFILLPQVAADLERAGKCEVDTFIVPEENRRAFKMLEVFRALAQKDNIRNDAKNAKRAGFLWAVKVYERQVELMTKNLSVCPEREWYAKTPLKDTITAIRETITTTMAMFSASQKGRQRIENHNYWHVRPSTKTLNGLLRLKPEKGINVKIQDIRIKLDEIGQDKMKKSSPSNKSKKSTKGGRPRDNDSNSKDPVQVLLEKMAAVPFKERVRELEEDPPSNESALKAVNKDNHQDACLVGGGIPISEITKNSSISIDEILLHAVKRDYYLFCFFGSARIEVGKLKSSMEPTSSNSEYWPVGKENKCAHPLPFGTDLEIDGDPNSLGQLKHYGIRSFEAEGYEHPGSTPICLTPKHLEALRGSSELRIKYGALRDGRAFRVADPPNGLRVCADLLYINEEDEALFLQHPKNKVAEKSSKGGRKEGSSEPLGSLIKELCKGHVRRGLLQREIVTTVCKTLQTENHYTEKLVIETSDQKDDDFLIYSVDGIEKEPLYIESLKTNIRRQIKILKTDNN